MAVSPVPIRVPNQRPLAPNVVCGSTTTVLYYSVYVLTCTYRGSGMAPTVGVLGAERELQRLRCVRGQDDATETGRRATPRRIVDIVRNRTIK